MVQSLDTLYTERAFPTSKAAFPAMQKPFFSFEIFSLDGAGTLASSYKTQVLQRSVAD